MAKLKNIEIQTVKHVEESIANSNFKNLKWHTGESLDFWPTAAMSQNNLNGVVTQLFEQSGPKEPIFTKQSRIMTMGSCFAMRIREWMQRNQQVSDTVFVPEGLNNSFAVRQFIEWALTGNRSSDAYWYDQAADKGIFKWESEEEQSQIKEKFKQYDGFVITFGLSEVWRDKNTKGVFWRGVPDGMFDVEKHECVISTVEENYDNMKRIIELIREHCGDKPIIFTLSPVPLNATFVGRPCVVSDCVSKSILRVAIEQINQLNFNNWYYWPSFELAKWVPAHMDVKSFGGDPKPDKKGNKLTDSRHVAEWAVSNIIQNFVKKFFK